MTNKDCDNCYKCSFCDNCTGCNYCSYCTSCHNCSFFDNGYNCTYCDYCASCYNCDYCASCDYSSFCTYCDYCDYCKNLKMTEYNMFCWAEVSNDYNSFQQKRYRIFNTQITEEEYDEIKIPELKLEFDKDENYETRYSTAFKEAWNKLSVEGQQEFLDLPHFNWEGFTFITGVTPDMVKKIGNTDLSQRVKQLEEELDKGL